MFHTLEHVKRGMIQLHKHTIVDLAEPQQLQDLSHLWFHLVDTVKWGMGKNRKISDV